MVKEVIYKTYKAFDEKEYDTIEAARLANIICKIDEQLRAYYFYRRCSSKEDELDGEKFMGVSCLANHIYSLAHEEPTK